MSNSFENEVKEKVLKTKSKKFIDEKISGNRNGHKFNLLPVTKDVAEMPELVSLLGQWRKKHESWFQAVFNVTDEGTKRWLNKALYEVEDRILFIIEIESKFVGHVGLFRIDYQNKTCEIDNIVRGEDGYPGIIQSAIEEMLVWARSYLGLEKFTLQTYSDNPKALGLYTKMGFIEYKREPMLQVTTPGKIEWVKAENNFKGDIKRYNVYMELNK